MKKTLFTGCGVALVTPFKNGKVDFSAFERHLDRLLSAGVDAYFPCGTTGEPATLTDEEWKAVIDFTVKKVNGRAPVIAGTGSNNTAHVIERAKIAADLGADAQLCVTPYYNKTTQAGAIAHFNAIADQSTLPVVVYNVPVRTGMDLTASTYAELAKHPNIIAVKDAGANVTKSIQAITACNDEVTFYSGEDAIVAPLLAVGYKGVVSVTANIVPEMVVKMSHLPAEEAGVWQKKLCRLNELMFCETSPIPAKAALSMMGIFEDELRLPLIPMSDANRALLRAELQNLGVL